MFAYKAPLVPLLRRRTLSAYAGSRKGRDRVPRARPRERAARAPAAPGAPADPRDPRPPAPPARPPRNGDHLIARSTYSCTCTCTRRVVRVLYLGTGRIGFLLQILTSSQHMHMHVRYMYCRIILVHRHSPIVGLRGTGTVSTRISY